ncbi:MAG TPA: hypothetical protein VN729_08725 [Ktedonobacteraceae bacterium]|nr:hypothetical protein [Ktedonobacteraceae bacterium]
MAALWLLNHVLFVFLSGKPSDFPGQVLSGFASKRVREVHPQGYGVCSISACLSYWKYSTKESNEIVSDCKSQGYAKVALLVWAKPHPLKKRELSEIGAAAPISLNSLFFKGWVGGDKRILNSPVQEQGLERIFTGRRKFVR